MSFFSILSLLFPMQ